MSERIYDVILTPFFVQKRLKFCTWSLPARFYDCAKFVLLCVKGSEVMRGEGGNPPPPVRARFQNPGIDDKPGLVLPRLEVSQLLHWLFAKQLWRNKIGR